MNNLNLDQLWDFNDPQLSEGRFRHALAASSGEEALILQTQIARTYGLRGDFSTSRSILSEIEPRVREAGPRVRSFYYLELGRSYCSAAHPTESLTPEARQEARAAYLRAIEEAHTAGLAGQAVDALHMLAFVEVEPERQLEWNRRALELAASSDQPQARKWEASLRNNSGYALHQLGRYREALAEFLLALEARQREGDPEKIRIAWWMIAWTLRALGRLQEALEIQLRLEKECDAAGQPDPYVYEELEILYREVGNEDAAQRYASKKLT